MTAHDFRGCPAKQVTREETLRVVRERSPFWLDGVLMCDWLELAGNPDQTILMLQDALRPGRGRYLGISNDLRVVRRNQREYGGLKQAEWVHDDLDVAIGARGKRTRYERVGVLAYDSERSLASEHFLRDLELVLDFATEQYQRLGAFLLVLNFVKRGKGVRAAEAAYKDRLARFVGRPDYPDAAMTTYRNKHPGVAMLLTRISLGF